MADWEPEVYARFRDLRLRPALDLLARVARLGDGDVVDLGCGAGAAGPALATRYPEHRLIGVDASPAMLDKARDGGAYAALTEADAATWAPRVAPALIFSNAVLQWLPDHERLLPRLAGLLAPGGTLAVQMPRQEFAPSHRFLRDIAAEMFPDRFDLATWQPRVGAAVDYARLLAPLGATDVWETDHIQRLAPAADAHPVRRFTEATAMRPFLARMTSAEAAAFIDRYEQALPAAYPAEPDGTVLFPFRRLFIVLVRG